MTDAPTNSNLIYTFADWLRLLEYEKDNNNPRMELAIWGRMYNRLKLIQAAVPIWLDLDIIHPLRNAVMNWEVEDFAILVGRGGAYPIEPGWSGMFQNAEELWLRARIGLGENSDKRGRPSRLNESEQAWLFDLWARGWKTQEELAEMYNIGIATVQRYIKKWKARHKAYDI